MYLSIAILVFGVLIFGIVVALQFKLAHGWGPHTTRMAGFTLLITSALFLVTTEIRQEALGAAFTLLGTIAGYLFGRKGKEEE
jgi:hypothetical protein